VCVCVCGSDSLAPSATGIPSCEQLIIHFCPVFVSVAEAVKLVIASGALLFLWDSLSLSLSLGWK